MRVLFVGGLDHIDDEEDRQKFENACRAIGYAFASADIEVVVGSDAPKTADRFIVQGVARAAEKAKKEEDQPQVWVVRPDYGDTPFSDEAYSKVRFHYRRFRGNWEAGRVPQMLQSDAVVLIGGGDGTLASGQIALALHKPIVSVAYFKGSAAKLWETLRPYYAGLGAISDGIDDLKEKWQESNATLIINAVKELLDRRAFDPRPRLPMGIFLTSLIGCLVAWTVLFARQEPITRLPMIYSYFLMLALAGFLGTILRTSMRLIRDPTARFSWNQLLLEVAAGLLLGFALTLLYLVGAITIEGKVMLDNNNESFERVAVVMTLLGLGGGLALEQASDRVSSWFNEQFRSGKP